MRGRVRVGRVESLSPTESVSSVDSRDGFPETPAGYRKCSEQRGGGSPVLPVRGAAGWARAREVDGLRPLLTAGGPGSPLRRVPPPADRAAPRHPTAPFSSVPGAPGGLRGVHTREEPRVPLQVKVQLTLGKPRDPKMVFCFTTHG